MNFVGLIIVCISVINVCSSETAVDPRIYGGYTIDISQAPYQVSIRLKSKEAGRFGTGHFCGGSVITSRVIATAAHCTVVSMEKPLAYRRAGEFTIVMGDTYLVYKTTGTLQFNVQQIVVHPNFDKASTLENDIALMLFNGDVPANNPSIRPIALNTVSIVPNTYCRVSGWGKINDFQISNDLMEAVVPTISNSICQIGYGKLPQSMMCAGYMTSGGIDACQGDSGGPMVCDNRLAGVISWGNGCAQAGYPGIYTNVSYFVGWIESTNATFNYSHYADGSVLIKSSLILILLTTILQALR